MDLEALIEDLTFFFKDNPFKKVSDLRGKYQSEARVRNDYNSALDGARRVLEAIEIFEEEPEVSSSLFSFSLSLKTEEREETIPLQEITQWSEFGPIHRSDLGRETIEYFKGEGSRSFTELEEKLKQYLQHLEEQLEAQDALCDSLQNQLIKAVIVADPREYKERRDAFNYKWQEYGISVEIGAVNRIPLNELTNPTIDNPFLEIDSESLEEEVKIIRNLSARLHLAADRGTIVNIYLKSLQKERVEDYYLMLFNGSDGHFNVGAARSYETALGKVGFRFPGMIEVADQYLGSIFRLLCDPYFQGPDNGVYMISLPTEDFSVLASHIRRLKPLFEKSE